MLPRGLKQHAVPTSHMTTIKLKGWKEFYLKGETKIRNQTIVRNEDCQLPQSNKLEKGKSSVRN